jgi:hypothetical protein
MSSEASEAKPGARLGLFVIALLLAGAVAGAAFYQEHIASFFAQEGWNPGAAELIVRKFVTSAHDPKGAGAVNDLVDPSLLEPVVTNGRLTALEYGQNMGRRAYPVKAFAPTAELKSVKTELLAKDGGSFRVLSEFQDGRWGEFKVRKVGAKQRIVQVPQLLTDAPLPRNPNDY